MTTLGECGEAELLQKLQVLLSRDSTPGSGVVQGVGDDAAVLQITPGKRLVSSCDMMIEGRHFELGYITPRQLGRKALAVNLSDMAAMGGTPRWAMVSLALPRETPLQFWEDFYRGMTGLAREAGVVVVGGDTTSSSTAIVDVSVLGEASPEELWYRSSASPGEFLLVTGDLGSSAAGLNWLKNEGSSKSLSQKEAEPLLSSHLRPIPRYYEAALLRQTPVCAAIDLSDGLVAGLAGICAASGVGAVVEASRLPFQEVTSRWSRQTGCSLLEWMLYGGEDYELLFTVSSEVDVPALQALLARETGTSLSLIGEITAPERGIILITETGDEILLEADRSYNHFAEG